MAVAACASGCATALRGTTQVVFVTSSPPGARCTLLHDDATEAGAVAATPGRATIARSSRDLVVICRKDGHYNGRTLLIAGERESLFREAMMRKEDMASPQQDEGMGAKEAATIAAGVTAVAGAAVGFPALIAAGMTGSAAAAGAAVALAPVGLLAGPLGMMVDASSGAYSAYPRSAAVMLLPREFSDVEVRDAAVARVLAALEQDDRALRKRFDESCGFTCRRANPAFEAFLAERRAEALRQRDAATITPR